MKKGKEVGTEQNCNEKMEEWKEIWKTHLDVFNRTAWYLPSHQFNIVCLNRSSVALHSYALEIDT